MIPSTGPEGSELLQQVTALSSVANGLEEILRQRGLPSLSMSSSPPIVDHKVENAAYHDAKRTILEKVEDIARLVRGPREHLVTLSFEHCATASLQVAVKYKFAKYVPLEGDTTYAAIAEAIAKPQVPAVLVERIIQHLACSGVFRAIPGGSVAHNACSALLRTDPDLEAWMDLSATIAYPAGAAIVRSLNKYGYSMEPDEAAFGISIDRKISQFKVLHEPDNPDLLAMFARAMRGIAVGGAYDVQHVVDGGYPWHRLSKVIDVGGGFGHVAVALARRYPSLHFEVQDLPETAALAQDACPDDVKARIVFQGYDFFTPQPPRPNLLTEQRVAYLCRFILHDWSDKYATKILQQLAAALRPGDCIIINEVLIPEPGEQTREHERRSHDRDMLMLMNLNGRERSLAALKSLGSNVVPQLRVNKVYGPTQGELSLVEMMLDAEPAP